MSAINHTYYDGPPLRYETPEAFAEAIDEYFESCKPVAILDNYGNPVMKSKDLQEYRFINPTLSGLAAHLGFTNRKVIYDYEKREGYGEHIARARLRIEALHESRLLDNTSSTGSQFWLKCNGWDDGSGKLELESHSFNMTLTPEEESLFKANMALMFKKTEVDVVQ